MLFCPADITDWTDSIDPVATHAYLSPDAPVSPTPESPTNRIRMARSETRRLRPSCVPRAAVRLTRSVPLTWHGTDRKLRSRVGPLPVT